MFTRHFIAAAALMASACAAHADVISTATDAQASTVSMISSSAIDLASVSSMASNMSIVAGTAALSGASSGLASMLSTTGSDAQVYLMRGAEGLYMLGASATAAVASAVSPSAGIDGGLAAQPSALDPIIGAAAVPEPSSIALMLAGVFGAVSVARRRKQK